jgi:hypothetical protein
MFQYFGLGEMQYLAPARLGRAVADPIRRPTVAADKRAKEMQALRMSQKLAQAAPPNAPSQRAASVRAAAACMLALLWVLYSSGGLNDW